MPLSNLVPRAFCLEGDLEGNEVDHCPKLTWMQVVFIASWLPQQSVSPSHSRGILQSVSRIVFVYAPFQLPACKVLPFGRWSPRRTPRPLEPRSWPGRKRTDLFHRSVKKKTKSACNKLSIDFSLSNCHCCRAIRSASWIWKYQLIWFCTWSDEKRQHFFSDGL